MSDYDQSARYAVRHLDVPGFFAWLLGQRFAAAWRFDRWLDTQAVPFPGLPDRRCDTVAAFDRVAGDHPPLAVVVEFMSRTRHPTLVRLAQYGFQVATDCPYQLDPRVEYVCVGAIVNLTGGEQPDTLTQMPPDTGGLSLKGKYKVATLQSTDAGRFLAAIKRGKLSRSLLVWMPLMRDADTAEFVGRWRAEVEREPDAHIRGDIVGLAMVLSELVEREPIWKRGLEGLDVERSKTVMEWEQRGELRRARSDLLKFLRFRCGGSLAQDLQQAIESQADLATLAEWIDVVLTPEFTPEMFRARIGLNGHAD